MLLLHTESTEREWSRASPLFSNRRDTERRKIVEGGDSLFQLLKRYKCSRLTLFLDKNALRFRATNFLSWLQKRKRSKNKLNSLEVSQRYVSVI